MKRKIRYSFTLAALLYGSAVPAMAQLDLLAWWAFNEEGTSGVTVDSRAGRVGNVLGGAARTTAGGGQSGTGADRAMVFGTGAQRVRVADASWIGVVSAENSFSISMWQKLNAVRGATAFSAVSPSVGGRGIQAHAPWADSSIYFDTGGCCTGGEHRSSGPLPFDFDVTGWNHWAFIKNGNVKQVYVNGVEVVLGDDFAPLPEDFTEMFIGNAPNQVEGVDGAIDDFAFFSGALTEAQILSLAAGALPDSLVTPNDSDGDGLPDAWEYRFFPGDLTKLTAAGDQDAEGVPDAQELARGTNPALADTDGDGLADNVEINSGIWVDATNTGTDPTIADTDGDTLADGVETNTGTFVGAANTGTTPLLRDTDGDGTDDGLELLYGSSPVNAGSTPVVPGVPTLLAYWDFNDVSDPAQSVDKRVGLVGLTVNGAVYTAAGEGRSGTAGDAAMNFPSGGARLDVNRSVINIGARIDKVSISFWQRRFSFPGSSSFWAFSPSSTDGQRGLQTHLPWSDSSTIFFDSAGCCAVPGQRLSGPIPPPDPDPGFDWAIWHHFVFVKNGSVKEVWVDGQLALAGDGANPLPTDFTSFRIGSDNGTGSIDGDIDDFAVFAAALAESDIARLAEGESPLVIATSSDSDTDGLPDAWEFTYFPNDLTKLSSNGDFDQDGVTDALELARDLLPNNVDTDGDSLSDGVETNTATWVSATNTGTNPKSADSDADGLRDGVESNTGNFVNAANTGSNPLLKDTDGDTFPDGVEVLYLTSPIDPAVRPAVPGQTTLLAWWPFNDSTNPDVAMDVQNGFRGDFIGGATYSADAEGRGAVAGDKAASLFSDTSLTVTAGGLLNAAAPGDALSISFWQKLDFTGNSSVFWGVSPTSGGGQRGIQVHNPWSDGNIYYDHGGCCTGDVDRINTLFPPEVDPLEWNHFVFTKVGNEKQIWVNGTLVLAGGSGVPLPSDFTTLYVGAGPPVDPPGSLNGKLDDFAIYAGGLTEAQILRLADGENPDEITSAPPVGNPIAVTSITRAADGSSVTITWTSEPGTNYLVQGSANLQTWSTVQADVPATGASTSFTMNNPPASPWFLRVRR